MVKQAGLGDRAFVDQYDLSGDTQAINQISGGPAALNFTAIDKSAFERLGGRRDGRIEWTSFFDDATDQAHDALSTLPTTDRVVTYLRGTTLGNAAASCVAKQINYDPTRAGDAMLTFGVAAESNDYGVQWGVNLTGGLVTSTTGESLGSIDDGAQTVLGAQGFLHVTGFTGTSATIKIRDSTDDSTFADLITFSSVTAAGAERVATSGSTTVDRYVRVEVSGTFSSVSYVVVFVRNLTATAF